MSAAAGGEGWRTARHTATKVPELAGIAHVRRKRVTPRESMRHSLVVHYQAESGLRSQTASHKDAFSYVQRRSL